MPRVLTIGRTTVAADQRAAFLARVDARRAHYAKAGVRYWVFEEASLPGAFVEFCEAADPDTLVAAHNAAPDPPTGVNRPYVELEAR
ncbi:MAG: hypothetical protein MUF53_11320 [Gemmatimonadaceae bacterium]|jgi:hypothetical protein|nr:hypothetical protein [Gemmatimonadaceae bacterium]